MDTGKTKQFTLIYSRFRYPMSTASRGYGCFLPDLTGFSEDTVPKDRTSLSKPRLLCNANASSQASAPS